MTALRAAIAALALTIAGAAAAHDPYQDHWYGDRGDGWYGEPVQYLYLSDTPLFRHDRLSRQRGFFDHGMVEGAAFAYDRGYPYDWFPYDLAEERPARSREVVCDTEWTRGRRGEEVPVRVCRGR